MSDKVDGLVLEHLRAIRTDTADLRADVRDIKTRLGNLESEQASIIQHLGNLAAADAAQQIGIDRRLEING
jgi:hypothetical protein